jgi:predicted dehydrogenase
MDADALLEAPPLRWGILATGGIARTFTEDLLRLPTAQVVAVGSRSQESADRFADRYGIARRHATYEALVRDEDVDAVYVSTPHPGHHAAARLAIDAGKAVLLEKPFTVDAAEAVDLVERARSRGVFLMEAMWTRFLPHVVRIRELLADGALGDVRAVHADHGQWFERDPAHRLFAPALGGGALLDLGVYPVSFASMVLGPPRRVTAVSDAAFTGVDAHTSMLLQHDGGRQAVLTTTLEAVSPTRAAVVGTEARLEVASPFYGPSVVVLTPRSGEPRTFDDPCERRGMQYEAAEVARCLAAGRTESDVMPLDETVSVMRTLDEVRRQIGLDYPSAAEPSGPR